MILQTLFAMALAGLPMQDPETPPTIDMYVSRNVAPSSLILINVNTTRLLQVDMAAYPTSGVDWVTHSLEQGYLPPRTGPAVKRWRQSLESEDDNGFSDRGPYHNRQIKLPALPVGTYRIEASGKGAHATAVVNVTNLSVVVKRSPTRLLAWVTDFKSGGVLAGAKVGVYNRSQTPIRQNLTNGDGVAVMPLGVGENAVAITRGKDFAGFWTGATNPDGQFRSVFQTDRPIYRPGQTVFFKAILRTTHGQGYDPVSGQPVQVTLMDPRDNPVDTMSYMSSAMGTITGEFKIPDEGMLGGYSLSLKQQDHEAFQTITVSEYRKPSFQVAVAPEAKHYLAGEVIHFKLNAKYYFGANLPQAEVQWVIRRGWLPYYFSRDPDDAWIYGGDGNLYPRDTYARDEAIGEGKVYTDAKGQATIDLESPSIDQDATYELTATVQDTSRRQVTASTSVPVYASSLRIGLKPFEGYVVRGENIPLEVHVSDVDGNPQPATVHLTETTEHWNQKKQNMETVTLVARDVRVPPGGRLNTVLPAKEAGEITITATTVDPTGRKTRTEIGVYVAGEIYWNWRQEQTPALTVRLDKKKYLPGETAKSYVETNIPGRPILVVLEGRDIFRYKVFKTSAAGQNWAFSIGSILSPNAYLHACQWAKTRLISRDMVVPVPDPRRRITVEVQPDQPNYHPGDQASFTVRTVDSKGNGLPAEVSLAVVDEAIYALSPDNTPDLYSFYWGLRQNFVSTAESAPIEVSGGAYQRVNSVAPVRQRFEDTAYWNGVVSTDLNGVGHVSFEMPGNLTSWRATARAVDGQTAVGSGKINVTASRPLMIRLATPRALVQGDRIVLIGTVNGLLHHDVQCVAHLHADGVSLGSGSERTFLLDGKSGQASLEWILDVKDIPASGVAKLHADVAPVNRDAEPHDAADALEMSVPIIPKGVPKSFLVGGLVGKSAETQLVLPSDKLEPATKVSIEVAAGLGATAHSSANEILQSGRYGTLVVAEQLQTLAALGWTGDKDQRETLREDLAFLSRAQSDEGWGWWEGLRAEPIMSAKVLEALSLADKAGIPIYSNLATWAAGGCRTQYVQSRLWEHKALLASALAFAGSKDAHEFLREVVENGQRMSPYARLKVAEALSLLGDSEMALKVWKGALKDASVGPTQAYFPTDFGIGWTADSFQTTAQALSTLLRLDKDPALQAKLAGWLAQASTEDWLCLESRADMVRALSLYLAKHPEAPKLGNVRITFNGKPLPVEVSRVANKVTARIPVGDAVTGGNMIRIERDGKGEALYTVRASCYVPSLHESIQGIRAMRRYETRDDAGVWREIVGPIPAGQPVRCTVVVWGDSLSDALEVREPLPAGFEVVDSEYDYGVREEVRDSAVIHYLANADAPTTFRYYLRPESEGRLNVLPISATYIRRPDVNGQSAAQVFVVTKP